MIWFLFMNHLCFTVIQLYLLGCQNLTNADPIKNLYTILKTILENIMKCLKNKIINIKIIKKNMINQKKNKKNKKNKKKTNLFLNELMKMIKRQLSKNIILKTKMHHHHHHHQVNL